MSTAAEQTLFEQTNHDEPKTVELVATETVPALVKYEDSRAQLIAAIAAAARDPKVDAAKMRELFELKKDIDAHDARLAFQEAMNAAQDEMKPVVRDAENKHTKSKYAKLEKIDKAIRPIYTKHGFALTFNTRENAQPNWITVTCKCLHRAGHIEPYEISGPLDIAGAQGTANKTGIQATGSSNQYLRRYLTCDIFNVILTDFDDDGEGTIKTISDEQKNKLLDLIVAQGDGAEKALLRLMMVERVEDILACNFDMAVTQLKDRARRLQERR